MEDQYYDIERRTAIKEEARMFRRKFITYEQAEVIYSISHRKLKVVLINYEALRDYIDYIETFREN